MSVASVHTSGSNCAGQEWRRERQKPLNINRYGAFADLPDYTFLDGRRTPPGPNKVRRALKQQEYAKKIMQYVSEVDFAVERQDRLRRDEQTQREEILARKLKPKGQKHA
ncbi:unnamed protein product [Allacma fusca]|uniref:Large ribosomal subunit protein mL52 n=1 Tax=Allacma fusca TaxID=39272 RepID=A0A8J2LLJ4_9HEXA|nr:unnamed protein product [Allacma fusca]